MGTTCKSLHKRGGARFYRGDGKSGGWAKGVQGLSLAESPGGNRGSLSSSCGVLLSSQAVRAPPAGINSI